MHLGYARGQLSVAMKGKLQEQRFCACVTVLSSPATFDNAFGFLEQILGIIVASLCNSFAFA